MPDLARTIENSQQIIIELCFTDLDLAFTFLQTAQVTSIRGTKQRNLANAVKVYRTISQKAAGMDLPSATRQPLEAKLAELSQQLAAWGVPV